MKKLITLFALFLAVPIVANNAEILVIGGTTNTGYAIVDYCVKQKIACDVFGRSTSKLQSIHGEHTHISYIEGKVEKDTEALTTAAKGKKYIFVAQDFPYGVWEQCMLSMTDNCITAASKNNAAIIFPGRIYKYGDVRSIHEDSNPAPNSKQGEVLLKVEERLEAAALEKKCAVFIIRHSYPFGTGVKDGLMDEAFKDVPKGKAFKWISRTDVETQLTYTPDFARFMFQYLEQVPEKTIFDAINFTTHTVESIDEFGTQLAEIASIKSKKAKYSPNAHSYIAMKTLSLVDTNAKRGVDTMYSFEKPILLDLSKMKHMFPQFTATPLGVALRKTLRAYAQ